MDELKEKAGYYKYLYKTGQCDRETAKENIQPYLDFINEYAKIVAKKYNLKPKFVNFSGYIR